MGSTPEPRRRHSHGHSHHGHSHHGHAGLRADAATAVATSPRIERILRIAVAVCAVITVVGLVVLWPSGDSASVDPAVLDADPIGARVQSVELRGCTYDPALECAVAVVGVTEGQSAGETFEMEEPARSSGKRLAAGDDILVLAQEFEDATTSYTFYEYERETPLLFLVMLFAATIVLLGRWRGVGALAGLVASLAIIVVFLLPSLLDGNNAVATALVATSVIAFVALYLAHGFNAATTVALLSTFAALIVTGVLSWIFVHAASFTGFTDDSTQFLDLLEVPIDPRGILLAGIMIGSLGVLDDVTVTQVSAVWELRTARPDLPTAQLYRQGLRVGRDHISSTVNTLFLAYAGAALPLLLLFSEANQGIGGVATREIVAVEVVRALVGSIGLVSAVPISTWLAAQVVRPRQDSSSHDEGSR